MGGNISGGANIVDNGGYGMSDDDWFKQSDFNMDGLNPTINTNQDTGSSFLGAAGNFFGGKDGMSNAGSLLGGVAGLGQMYLANQQQKDTQKTNSLYRKLMTDEAAYRTKFRDGWGSVSFGGK